MPYIQLLMLSTLPGHVSIENRTEASTFTFFIPDRIPGNCTANGIYVVLTFRFFNCIGYNPLREYMDMGIYDYVARIRKSGISDMISASISSYDLGFTCFCMIFHNTNNVDATVMIIFNNTSHKTHSGNRLLK